MIYLLKNFKKNFFLLLIIIFSSIVISAQEKNEDAPIKKKIENNTSDEKKLWVNETSSEEGISLGKVTVKAKEDSELGKKVIKQEDYSTPGSKKSIMDLTKYQATIDFRGMSDKVADDDTYNMRGFSAKRFVTAIDGQTIRKTGGRKSSHIVDYGLLPSWLIDSVEILPGPHSALYPAKAIGGVLNFKTRKPKKYITYIPHMDFTTSYESYNTQLYDLSLYGGANLFNYDVGYQRSSTDGHLRNSKEEIDNIYVRLGCVFPKGGFITVSASYAEADREIPVNNYEGNPDTNATYNSDYPTVSTSEFNNWQEPSWDKIAHSYRLHLEVPSVAGTWSLAGYWGTENRDREYPEYINKLDPSLGTRDGSWETIWTQWGLRLADEVSFLKNHTTTFAFDFDQLIDGYGHCPNWTSAHDDKKRVEIISGAIQHQARFLDSLVLTLGLRYEDVRIWVSNFSASTGTTYISGRGRWIEEHWGNVLPKLFITYELESLSKKLRDTSISAGVSRIWHAPDYHGIYNPQGRPTGAWIEPEDGVGFDFIFSRRLWKDIKLRTGYSLHWLVNYIALNQSFAEYTTPDQALSFKDYVVNLKEAYRHGVEFDISGHVLKPLFLYISYAFQRFESKGNENAGKTEFDDRPEHILKTGVRYTLNKTKTSFMLDYLFKSEEVKEIPSEPLPDVYVFNRDRLPMVHLLDFALEQKIIDKQKNFLDFSIKFYVKNILGHKYENERGYPAAERTVGGALNVKF